MESDSGEAALRLFEATRARGVTIDLVLTDLIMPAMGGRELGEAIAAIDPGIPILYTSGYTGDEVARRGLIAEGAAFLSKPFAPEELLERIRGMIDRAARRT
jgi:CheY-like chemotaxis protein